MKTIQTKLIPRTPSAYAYPLLIKRILEQSLKYEPNRPIIYRDLFQYNYIGLNERVRRLANVLQSAGIKPGDTVAVFDWDSHRYLECFFAIPMIGAILHTINIRLSPAQILYTMNHAEDQLVLIHEDFLPILEAIKSEITTVKKYIIISDKVYQNESVNIPTHLPYVGEYEGLLKEASTEYEFPDFDEDTWATTFYTTGTTGNPKGVYFSHRQIFLHTLTSSNYLGAFQTQGRFRSDDVYMPITPMFHVHAWSMPFIATLLGTKQVYPGRYEPQMLLQLLVKEKVTFSHCVPTILQMLVSSPAVKQIDLSNWKVIIGGSALTPALAKAALELGIDVYAGYGMSETAPVMAITYLSESILQSDKDYQVLYRTKAGVIAPFVELALIDEAGNFLPHDGQTVGELVARGPWMTQGYYKEKEKSEELWKGGWLHTGDIASITPDSFVQISDRAKDVIKTGGEWVSSIALESIISEIAGVMEVAVVGLPDEKWGERPNALIVLKPDAQLNQSQVKDHLQKMVSDGTLNRYYLPDKIAFVAEIPKTSVGKIDKKKIRQEMADIFK
jgi:fatty-acyl-CoA synthase